jgi:4-hydroxybenzoyl-CoA reductase subunit gamma
MLLATHALIERSPKAGRDEIEEALAGHVCRCTGYVKIIDSVRAATEAAP